MFAKYAFKYDSFQGNTQNVREFLGELFGLIVIYLQFYPPRGTRVAVRGDKMSALSWLGKNKTKSSAALYGFLAYTWVIIITGFKPSIKCFTSMPFLVGRHWLTQVGFPLEI